jgi:MoaA/NifB/PqqE/SkfB family radical SAM enzyme
VNITAPACDARNTRGSVSQVQILLTERCNIRCKHCAVPAEDSPADHELSTGEWKAFLDAAVATGVESVVMNGGEALIRRDALELIEHAFEAGIQWATLITNGMLFGARAAAAIANTQRRFPAFAVHVSVDGATAQTHDWMRGDGTFDRMLASVGRLCDAGGRIGGVNSVVHRGNVHEFEDLAALAASWGAEVWTVFPSADLGRGVALGDSRLSRAIWVDLYERARRVRDRYGMFVGIGGPVMVDEWPEDDDLVPTPRVSRPDKACIGPDGAVFTCPPLRGRQLGSVADGCDESRWSAIAERAAETLDQSCASCKYLLVCTNVDLDNALRPRPGKFGAPAKGAAATGASRAAGCENAGGGTSGGTVPLTLTSRPPDQV